MAKPVLNKRDFYDRFLAGEFGNAMPHWRSFAEFFRHRNASEQLEVGVRWREPGRQFITMRHYVLAANEARKQCGWPRVDGDAVREPASPPYILGIQPPNERITINAELWDSPDGPSYLSVCGAPITMRHAMKMPLITKNITSILERYMDWESLSNIAWLREAYPSHVIEFTCYDGRVGTLGHNTVFWEVRKY